MFCGRNEKLCIFDLNFLEGKVGYVTKMRKYKQQLMQEINNLAILDQGVRYL